MSHESLNIYQRINEVRKKINYVKKDKKVQGYMAVTHDNVTAEIRRHLIDFGVLILPSHLRSETISTGTLTSSGTPIIRLEAVYAVNFINIDDPKDFITVEVIAHANDTSDKAPGKVVSYAAKYAMLKVFNIETGENEESRTEGTTKYIDSLKESIEAHKDSIEAITNALSENDLDTAAEAYSELTYEEISSIWIAPTKAKALGIDPPFTTKERAILKSDEFAVIRKKYKAQENEI